MTGGRADVANNIIYPAVRGNYVVTPNHLKGTDPIYFVGPAPDAPLPETDRHRADYANTLIGTEANSALRSFDKIHEGRDIVARPGGLF